jgi:hypothetical protein
MTSLLSFLKRLWPWTRPRRSPARPPMDFAGPEVPVPETAAPEAEVEAGAADETDVVRPVLVEPPHAELENVVETPPEPREQEIAEAVNDNQESEEEEDEDAHDPDEEVFVEDADQLDGAVSPARLAIERDLAEALRLRRAGSQAHALIGEHRIYLSDPTGPGSLAEALNTLVQQGQVTAEFLDDGEAGAFILYRPADSGVREGGDNTRIA